MGDDHFIKLDNDFTSSEVSNAIRKLYPTHPVCQQAADEIEWLSEKITHNRKVLHQWTNEVGKLHAQVATARDQRNEYQKKTRQSEDALVAILQAHEMEKKVLYEALERALSHFAVMPGEQATIAAQEIEELLASDCDKQGETGMNWQVSDETLRHIEEINANRRNAALNAGNITAGSPSDRTADVTALADAMWQLLDDMGENGQGVCLAAKAQARVAYEAFREDEYADWMPLERAKQVLKDAGV